MAIYFVNNKIKDIYVGSIKIKEVYYGSEKVWGEAESIQEQEGYWVHKDTGVKTYFGADADFITDGIMSKPSWATNASEVQIPSGVTGLGSRCFYNCYSLTSINIPESVTSIGNYCFYNCSALTLATVLPTIPPSIGVGIFNNTHISLSIKVRSPYVNDYKTAPNWIDYASKISGIPVIIDSYWIDKNNNTHYFDSYNTPIENFYGWDSNKIINGETVNKDSIEELHFGDSYANVTSIGDYFLHAFQQTSVINLSGLSNVTSVGNYFLNVAGSITSMDLSVFNLNSIGKDFMSSCKLLTSINLSGLSNVTSIDGYFLEWSEKLTSIDLSPLSNVTTIERMFLYSCYNLESIDLSPLSKVTSIGDYFLGDCINLNNIDLSGLSNVTNIGVNFLNNIRVSVADLSPLSNLTNIGYNFLGKNNNLNRVIMGSIIPPILDDYLYGDTLLNGSDNVSLIQVPCGSENAYKKANNWSSKADLIKGDC